jgi:hypothetical protein
MRGGPARQFHFRLVLDDITTGKVASKGLLNKSAFQEDAQPPALHGQYADYDKRVHTVTVRQGRSAN